jgi:hypothetical protein
MSDTVEVVTLIKTTLSRRGKGTPTSPVRVITEYWSLDGEKIVEVDPFTQGEEGKE